MLNLLRKSIDHVAIKIFLIALIVIFLSMGSIGVFLQKNRYALEIGDMKYTKEGLDQAIDGRIAMFEAQGDAKEDHNMLRSKALWDIVRQAMFLQESKRLNLLVGDDVVKYRIANDPYFQRDGKFSKEIWDEYFRSKNISEEVFVKDAKDLIAEQQLAMVFSSGRLDTDVLINQLFAAIYDIRDVELFQIKKSSIALEKKPHDADLKRVYEENIDKFSIPEKREVSYFILAAGDLKFNAEISDDEIKELYRKNIKLLYSPEKRRIQQLLLKTEKEALDIMSEIKKGAKFEDVAKHIKLDSEIFDMGFIASNDLPQEISAKIFQLQLNQISSPLKTSFGWHIFKVCEILPAKTKTFDESRELLRAQISDEKKFQKFESIRTAIASDFASGILDMKALSKKYNLILRSTEVFEGRPNIHLSDDAVRDIFLHSTLKERGEFFDGKEKDIFYEIHSIEARKIKDFKSVQNAVHEIWLNKAMYQKAEEIMNGIKQGDTKLDKKFISSYSKKFSVEANDKDFDESWSAVILGMKEGDFSPMIETQNFYEFFRLNKIEPFNGENIALLKAETKRNFIFKQREMLMEQYYKYLRQIYLDDEK